MSSSELAGFVAALKYSDLSSEVVEMAKRCVQDLIGVAIAGSKKPASLIWQDLMQNTCNSGEASVWAVGYPRMSRWNAACVNGAMGHVLDMDDLHNASIVHLAAVTVPAAMAVGQYLGRSGADVITSVVVGYEVGARVGEAINPSSYWYWHTTGIAGNLSAAAAAGKLLGLDAAQMNHCLGSAGSQAAGLWEFIADGAMSKTLHAGKACMNGIMAAELAQRGFTGASRILEGEKGLVKAVAPDYKLEALTNNFAQPYKIMENSLKPYACCRHTHSAIFALTELVKEFNIKPGEVARILDKTYSTAIDVTDNPNPRSQYGHKFSLQYCLAAALVYGNMYDEVFSGESITNPLVQELMKKVVVLLDPGLDAEYKADPAKWVHELELETNEGRKYNKRVEYPLGDVLNPLDQEMADNKFRLLTREFLTEEETERLLKQLHHLEKLDDVNRIFPVNQ